MKNKQRFIDHPEYKKLCACNLGKKLTETSRKLKEFYKTHHSHMYGKTHSDECKKTIGKKSKLKFTKEFKIKMRKIFESKGMWIPLDQKNDKEIYYKESNWICRMYDLITDNNQIILLKERGIFNSKNNSIGVVRDHMYSRKSGFENRVFPEILRHPCNCQLIPRDVNTIKYFKNNDNVLTLEELFIKIQNYNKKWCEQELVLQLIKDYKDGKRWNNKYKE